MKKQQRKNLARALRMILWVTVLVLEIMLLLQERSILGILVLFIVVVNIILDLRSFWQDKK